MPPFKTINDAQTNITLRAKVQCATSSSLHIHGNIVVNLLRANAGNVLLQGDLVGMQMVLVSLEIRQLQSHFANQITNEKLPEPFVFHFTTTCFMEQEGIKDGHIC
jgi:hypothetical protein